MDSYDYIRAALIYVETLLLRVQSGLIEVWMEMISMSAIFMFCACDCVPIPVAPWIWRISGTSLWMYTIAGGRNVRTFIKRYTALDLSQSTGSIICLLSWVKRVRHIIDIYGHIICYAVDEIKTE